MKITVASGKGGTGKTSVATSLVLCGGSDVQYLDCDVEEPNGHIFLHPDIEHKEMITVTVPLVNEESCTGCGRCVEICRYNAIIQVGGSVMTFPEMCHSCKGCFLVCDDNALVESTREIGIIEYGQAGNVSFVHGKLRIGEAMGVPLLKAVKKRAAAEKLVIIDAPPGTSCSFVESIKDADYVILVTEPTPFGLYDLKLAVDVVNNFKQDCGIIINRSDLGNDSVKNFCFENEIEVLMEIPFQRAIAEGYARGKTFIETVPELRSGFHEILARLKAKEIGRMV